MLNISNYSPISFKGARSAQQQRRTYQSYKTPQYEESRFEKTANDFIAYFNTIYHNICAKVDKKDNENRTTSCEIVQQFKSDIQQLSNTTRKNVNNYVERADKFYVLKEACQGINPLNWAEDYKDSYDVSKIIGPGSVMHYTTVEKKSKFTGESFYLRVPEQLTLNEVTDKKGNIIRADEIYNFEAGAYYKNFRRHEDGTFSADRIDLFGQSENRLSQNNSKFEYKLVPNFSKNNNLVSFDDATVTKHGVFADKMYEYKFDTNSAIRESRQYDNLILFNNNGKQIQDNEPDYQIKADKVLCSKYKNGRQINNKYYIDYQHCANKGNYKNTSAFGYIQMDDYYNGKVFVDYDSASNTYSYSRRFQV